MTRRLLFSALVGAVIAGSAFAAGYQAHQPAPLRPCVTEDSPGPCWWDATTQGNGHGRSFVVTADNRVIYLGSPS